MNASYYDGKVDASYPTQGLLAEELKRVIPEVQYASGLEYALSLAPKIHLKQVIRSIKWEE